MIIVIVHVLVRITNATRTKLHLMPVTRIQREKREKKTLALIIHLQSISLKFIDWEQWNECGWLRLKFILYGLIEALLHFTIVSFSAFRTIVSVGERLFRSSFFPQRFSDWTADPEYSLDSTKIYLCKWFCDLLNKIFIKLFEEEAKTNKSTHTHTKNTNANSEYSVGEHRLVEIDSHFKSSHEKDMKFFIYTCLWAVQNCCLELEKWVVLIRQSNTHTHTKRDAALWIARRYGDSTHSSSLHFLSNKIDAIFSVYFYYVVKILWCW